MLYIYIFIHSFVDILHVSFSRHRGPLASFSSVTIGNVVL